MGRRHMGPTEFGRLLRERRLALSMSQEELSERVGMSQEWASMVELGKIRQPRIATLQRLSKVIGVPIEELIVAVGYATTRKGAEQVIPDDLYEPRVHASLLALADLSPKRQQQIVEMIETFQKADEDEAE